MLQNVKGCNIHYEIKHNSKSSEIPVLLLHGWGCEGAIFAGIMDSLQKYATVITLDFPAHGQSEEPPEPWGVAEYAEQVKQLLQKVNIVKVDVVAHSFGARVAIYLASHYPDCIQKLVITGGAGIQKPVSAKANKQTSHYKRLRNLTNIFIKVPLLKAPVAALQEKLVQHYGSADYVKLSKTMRASFVKIIAQDLTPYLTAVKAPALLIWGSQDSETPLWMGKTMEEKIPDAGLVVFDGRSHFAFLEESERFILITKQFFWGGSAQ